MVVVKKEKGESKDSLFRRFNKLFLEENVVEEFKRKLFYKKPSLWRKEKKKLWERAKRLRRLRSQQEN